MLVGWGIGDRVGMDWESIDLYCPVLATPLCHLLVSVGRFNTLLSANKGKMGAAQATFSEMVNKTAYPLPRVFSSFFFFLINFLLGPSSCRSSC